MPTIAGSNVPPPKSWDEFEDITLSAAKLRWGSNNFYRNGRQGQKQEGVDIWGRDQEERQIGIQCKNTIGGVTEATVKAEIEYSESFKPTLKALYIATTANRDASIQKSVREISEQRRAADNYSVDVLFWDDICQDLAVEERVFFKHYPQFRERSGARTITDAQAAKMRRLIGTSMKGEQIFVESIGDQEADAFAAKVAVFLRSLGASVTEQQHNLKLPKPEGVLFRYSSGNQAGSLLMGALKDNDVEGIEKGGQVIADSNIYIRIGIKPL